jgi:quercetin dioxygenase-like cupin family protein
MEGLTVIRREDLERTGNWLLARRSLELSSFGMNLVEIPPGERIPGHDEAGRDHEEVFVVLSGSPTLVVEGREIAAPAGTFARLDPLDWA